MYTYEVVFERFHKSQSKNGMNYINARRMEFLVFVVRQGLCRFSLLKCICNENFDFEIFTSSENFIFSDHFDTNLVAKFELEVCEFLV